MIVVVMVLYHYLHNQHTLLVIINLQSLLRCTWTSFRTVSPASTAKCWSAGCRNLTLPTTSGRILSRSRPKSRRIQSRSQSCETDYHRPHPQEAHRHLLQTVPKTSSKNLVQEDCKFALSLQQTGEQKHRESEEISEGCENKIGICLRSFFFGLSNRQVGYDKQICQNHNTQTQQVQYNLQGLAFSDGFDDFALVFDISTIMFLFLFAAEKANQNTDSVGSNSNESVGLVVDSELSGHIEQLIGFKQNILILQDTIAEDKRNEYAQPKQCITQPSLGSVDDEKRSSQNSQQNIYLDDPKPLQAHLAVHRQISEQKPHLIHHGWTVSSIVIFPELVERLICKAKQDVGSHSCQDQTQPFHQQLVEKVSPNFVETAQPIERKCQLCTQDKHDHTICNLDIAEEDSSQRIKPLKRLDFIGCDCLAIAELSGKNDAQSCKEQYRAKQVFLCLSLEYSAVPLIEIEQFVVIFLLYLLLHQRVCSLLLLPIVGLVHLFIFLYELVFHGFIERQPDGPQCQNSYPNPHNHVTGYQQPVGGSVSGIVVYFDIFDIQLVDQNLLDVLLGTF